MRSRSQDSFPRQALTFKEKNDEWRKDCVNAAIRASNFGDSPDGGGWRSIMSKWYEYYVGQVDYDDYKHVLNPFAREGGWKLPAKIRSHPILKKTVDLLIGEYASRPDRTTVAVSNPDAQTIRQEKKKQEIIRNLMDWAFFELNSEGLMDLGEEEMPPLPEDIEAQFERSYKDSRAIKGQQVLNYVEWKKEVARLLRKSFFDFLVGGMPLTLKEIVHGDIHYEVLNPLDVDFDMDSDIDFIEDCNRVVIRREMSKPRIIDHFYEDLSDKDVKELDEDPPEAIGLPFFPGDREVDRNEFFNRGDKHEVYRVFWKSMEKIGELDYLDEWGEWQSRIVDDTYKKKPGDKIKWYWRNEWWEGTRIGGEDGIFVRMRPLPVQRREADNLSLAKGPVNGFLYSARNSEFTSLVGLGVPYAILYNIYRFRLELALAKAKGVIAMMDIDELPEGWEPDEFLYRAEATGFGWRQSAKEGYMNTHSAILDLTAKGIDQYRSIIEQVLNEWEDVSGVNRQRYGGITQYDGKGTSEQAIIQSSHITEDMFTRFDEFKRREREGLLDLAKVAYATGKKGSYILSDGTSDWLEVEAMELMESEFDIHVVSSTKESAKINQLKFLGEQMIQAGWKPTTIAEIIDGESFAEIKDKLRAAEQVQEEIEAMQAQQLQKAEEMRSHLEMQKMQMESIEADKDRQNRLDIAMIKQSGDSSETIAEINARVKERELDIKDKEVSLRNAIEKAELSIKRLDIYLKDSRKKEELSIKRSNPGRMRKN